MILRKEECREEKKKERRGHQEGERKEGGEERGEERLIREQGEIRPSGIDEETLGKDTRLTE